MHNKCGQGAQRMHCFFFFVFPGPAAFGVEGEGGDAHLDITIPSPHLVSEALKIVSGLIADLVWLPVDEEGMGATGHGRQCTLRTNGLMLDD